MISIIPSRIVLTINLNEDVIIFHAVLGSRYPGYDTRRLGARRSRLESGRIDRTHSKHSIYIC